KIVDKIVGKRVIIVDQQKHWDFSYFKVETRALVAY
ncbi:MAG: hypothetical protein ACI92Z_003305, partial [Paracoccaceae bacterium]